MSIAARAWSFAACLGIGLGSAGCGLLLDFDREDLEDASVADAGADAGPQCERDEDCVDDGRFCSVERCENGQCLRRTRDCEDEIECTAATCDEAARRCLIVPKDDQCEEGEICLPPDGCQEPPECKDPEECGFDDDVCNGIEVCRDGHCAIDPPPEEPEAIGCLTATCDATDGWTLVPVDAQCDDSRSCTHDTCEKDGECLLAPQDDSCGDDVDCTEDLCRPMNPRSDPVSGCIRVPRDQQCPSMNGCRVSVCDPATGCGTRYDNDACQTGEYCAPDGFCAPLSNVCDDDSDCDDDNPCNGLETCAVDICIPGSITCPPPLDPCLEAFCLDVAGLPACGTRVTDLCFGTVDSP